MFDTCNREPFLQPLIFGKMVGVSMFQTWICSFLKYLALLQIWNFDIFHGSTLFQIWGRGTCRVGYRKLRLWAFCAVDQCCKREFVVKLKNLYCWKLIFGVNRMVNHWRPYLSPDHTRTCFVVGASAKCMRPHDHRLCDLCWLRGLLSRTAEGRLF